MTKLVGIINITPDSFSDGGVCLDAQSTKQKALELIGQGVDVIDIGAESTRPGATPISSEEEWNRLEKPLYALLEAVATRIPISVDTYHPETAYKALALGVEWINDVSGINNPEMVAALKKYPHAKIVLMHNLGIPADPRTTIPEDADPIALLIEWGRQKLSDLEKLGIFKDRLIFDAGVGFGKTAKQSMKIIRNAAALRRLGMEIMIGHSRKSFLSLVSNAPAKDRDIETCAASIYLLSQGIDYLRVHDVDGNQRALKLWRMVAS